MHSSPCIADLDHLVQESQGRDLEVGQSQEVQLDHQDPDLAAQQDQAVDDQDQLVLLDLIGQVQEAQGKGQGQGHQHLQQVLRVVESKTSVQPINNSSMDNQIVLMKLDKLYCALIFTRNTDFEIENF